MIGGSFMIAVGSANAASSGGYSLYQCANGGTGTLQSCSGANYQHGDLNPTNSHWAEGDFVPFQLRLTGLASGSYTVAIKYKTVDNGLHAYDYLGSFDATETTSPTPNAAHANGNNPCSTVIPGCDPTKPTDTVNIPAANLTGLNLTCASTLNDFQPSSPTGKFSLWGPSGSAFTGAPTYETPLNQATQHGGKVTACFTIVDVSFKVPSDNASLVLAWGGHVASALDWGPDTGAGGISGDPYHMSIDHVTGLSSTGSEDRAMTVSATQPTISTVIEDAANTPVITVPAGASVHDTATLSGTTSTAGGTVTYEMFDNGTCTGDPTTTYPPVTVTNGTVPNSPSSTPGVGTWSYLAVYSGDAHNESATGACEGPLAVTEAPIAIIDVVKSELTPGDGQTVTAGQSTPITYGLKVTNAGNADASNVVVTDVIPTGTTYVAGSAKPAGAAPSYDPTANTITWTIPTVPAAAGAAPGEVDLTFQAKVDSSDIDGSTILNVASFSDLNTPNCTPLAPSVTQTCLTNQVSNPVTVEQSGGNPQQTTTTVAPTTTAAPTTTVAPTSTTLKPALAFTGAHTGLLSLLGAGLIGTGGAVLALSRRRRPSGR